MVRPEPDQPLGEADLGAERGIEARLGLVEEDLLRQRRVGGRAAGACSGFGLHVSMDAPAALRASSPPALRDQRAPAAPGGS